MNENDLGVKMQKKSDKFIPEIKSWLSMHQLFYSIMKYEEDEFLKVGISMPKFYILAAIKYLPDPVTPTDVAKWLDRLNNTITIMINQMQKKRTHNKEKKSSRWKIN